MKQSIFIFRLILTLVCILFPFANSFAAENVLTIATPEEIEGTDSHQVYWYNIVHDTISEPIVRLDLQNANIVPALASSMDVSPDGKTLTFKIPDGLTFTNGDPLTANEIKASIDRYIEISPYSADFEAIEKIIVQDKNTLVMKASQPPAYIWPALASVASGVMNPKVIKGMDAAAFNRNAISFGMASVEEWVQGSHILLARNPNYKANMPFVDNKGPIHFEKIKVRFIPDAFTRVAEFMAGNLDIIIEIPEENVDEIMSNPNLMVFEGYAAGVNWIMVNHRNEPLSDLKVRRAIALSINREELKTVLMDKVMPIYGMLSPSQICFSEEGEKEFTKENAMNIEKAKQLLSEAGWKDSNGDGILEKDGKDLSIEIAVPLDNSAQKRVAPVLQAQLKKIGVGIKLREFETSYVKQMVRDHKYDMAIRSYNWLDPSDLSYKFHTEASGIYSDPVLDKLLDEGMYIMDNKKRAEKYTEAQKQIFAQSVAIPMFVSKYFHGWQKGIKGVKFDSTGSYMSINDAHRE